MCTQAALVRPSSRCKPHLYLGYRLYAKGNQNPARIMGRELELRAPQASAALFTMHCLRVSLCVYIIARAASLVVVQLLTFQPLRAVRIPGKINSNYTTWFVVFTV